MKISVFDLFTIGIGPSSSHTVGPMRAAKRFADSLRDEHHLGRTTRVCIELFGSLGHTGKGHGSDRGVLLGLMGETPESVDPATIEAQINRITNEHRLLLAHTQQIDFDPARDLIFHRRETLPGHPNGMRFRADAADGTRLSERIYYSIGGGFVRDAEPVNSHVRHEPRALPFPFHSGDDLLRLATTHGLSIGEMMWRNECEWHGETTVATRLDAIWTAMQACVERGCATEGILPGGLRLERRAPALQRKLQARDGGPGAVAVDSLAALDWVNLFALAVNEENAAGGRVVTAPTNGAAGIVPAVLHYYARFIPGANVTGIRRFLLAAGAIGILYKLNASISGAEVGCQGEVGVACSMAAGALTEVLGGTPAQAENAAEIGMEHNLGLTCDPIGGLVQIPCIERNAMGAVKAINAARMALQGDGKHRVSLDKVIATMRQTGADMSSKYKETSRGGLAVNVIEC